YAPSSSVPHYFFLLMRANKLSCFLLYIRLYCVPVVSNHERGSLYLNSSDIRDKVRWQLVEPVKPTCFKVEIKEDRHGRTFYPWKIRTRQKRSVTLNWKKSFRI